MTTPTPRTNKQIADHLFEARSIISAEGAALKNRGEVEASDALAAAWFLVKQAMERIGG